jgi:hypothetical protein
MKKLKVGFLVDELIVSHYVYELINHVCQEDLFCEPTLIHGYGKKPSLRKFSNSLFLNFGLIKVINQIIFRILKKIILKIELPQTIKLYPNYTKEIELNNNLNYREVLIMGKWSKSGEHLNFTNSDLKLLGEEKFDCIIQCGDGLVNNDILNIAKLGIFSFDHNENLLIKGSSAGFWEVFYNKPSSEFVIQKLTKELNESVILEKGNLMTLSTWTHNHAQISEKSNFFLINLLDKIAESRSLPKSLEPRLNSNMTIKLDSSVTLFLYILLNLIPLISKKLLNKLLTEKVTRWGIAYSKHNDHTKELSSYKEIKNPSGRFLADPFVFSHEGKNVIFVEDLFYSDNKGRISAIQLHENSEEFLGVVLEEDFHLSFPFIFKEKGNVYMIPESTEARDIRLYRCLEFPKKWILDKTLMKDVFAADTMMIKHDNLWFMLTNICSSGIGEYQSELHIFFSNRHNSTDWKPIEKGNPVLFDSLAGRNGGLFYQNGDIYRVNQIQGKSHYGKSFGVNRVLHLSSSEYLEERIRTIDANYKEDIYSTHHFNANSEFAVLDFCRLERIKNINK